MLKRKDSISARPLSHCFPHVWITLCIIVFSSTAHAEIIEGFRDLKFGMTEKEVASLEACSTSSECLYELAGKNRYITLDYSQTPGNQSLATLSTISIDMGRFTDHWYEELQIRLQSQYQLTNDILDRDIAAFEKMQISELTSGYDHGQVLLKVVRRQFGNLILKVIYQNKERAAETLKEFSATH